MTEQFPGGVLDLLDAAGDRVVFEHLDRAVTGSRLLADVRRLTAGLRQHGVGPGDGVALLLGVGPKAFAAVVAAHAVGARVVGVRPGLTDRQREHLLADVAYRVTDDPDTAPSGTVLALADLLSAPDDGVRPRVTARPGDVARLLHTSGSTGLPKACAQSYAAMTAAW
ncbi:AMP-binding protein, partial [Streptomyces sp. TRM76130]|nr:AMP-binding protein [Streptomyces sp. TRM76130]